MWKFYELEDKLGVAEKRRQFYIQLCYLCCWFRPIFENAAFICAKSIIFRAKCNILHQIYIILHFNVKNYQFASKMQHFGNARLPPTYVLILSPPQFIPHSARYCSLKDGFCTNQWRIAFWIDFYIYVCVIFVRIYDFGSVLAPCYLQWSSVPIRAGPNFVRNEYYFFLKDHIPNTAKKRISFSADSKCGY